MHHGRVAAAVGKSSGIAALPEARSWRRCGGTSCADHSRKYPDACISVNASASEPTDRGKPIRAPGRPILLGRLPVDSPRRRGASDASRTTYLTPGACPATAEHGWERMPNPVRFGLYLVLA